jgi:hypothetical protein
MIRNLPASIQARLHQVARNRGEEFQRTLTSYAVERFLYRLSCLPTRDTLWLKGARLFDLWFDVPKRATADVDFLGFGASDIPAVREAIEAICRQEAEDGVIFDPDTLTVEPIREEARYGGLRARLAGRLGAMRCPIQLDIGFGDAVTPGPEEAEYPTLLPDMPAPRLKVYPKATVMAEKLEAVIHLGMANSRMKDYFDLRVLVRDGNVNDAELARAIRATFGRRRTPIPDGVPLGLSDAFARDSQKLTQWSAFLRRNRLGEISLEDVVGELREALMGPLREAGR